jgi:hypothetical protein
MAAFFFCELFEGINQVNHYHRIWCNYQMPQCPGQLLPRFPAQAVQGT